MVSIRVLALFAALFCLNGCVRDREERLPDDQAGDSQIFADKRRDVEARLNDKLTGLESRYQALRMNATPGAAVRSEVDQALQQGFQAVTTARLQFQELTGSNRNGWDTLRAQTEESIKMADEIWNEFEKSRPR